MKSYPRASLYLAIALLLSHCAGMRSQFSSSVTGENYTPRTSSDKIELFRSQTPSKKFTEIGVVNACCSADTTVLIESLKQKAAESGGDAIMALDIQAVGGATATVIRYQ